MADEITLAFAGTGKVTANAVRALLNDFLGFGEPGEDGWPTPPDEQINLIFPVTDGHWNDSLNVVFEWSESVDLPYTAVTDTSGSPFEEILTDAQRVIVSEDVNQGLIEELQGPGQNYLILLLGDDSDSSDIQDLLELAEEDDIEVRDLTAGLDQVILAAPVADVEPPEEEEAIQVESGESNPPEALVEVEELLEEESEDAVDEEEDVPKVGAFVDIKRARKAREDAADEAQTLLRPSSKIPDDWYEQILDRLVRLEATLLSAEKPKTPKPRGKPRAKKGVDDGSTQ